MRIPVVFDMYAIQHVMQRQVMVMMMNERPESGQIYPVEYNEKGFMRGLQPETRPSVLPAPRSLFQGYSHQLGGHQFPGSRA